MFHPLIAQASNIKMQENPAFTVQDFLEFYPQFTNLIPNGVMSYYVEMSRQIVSQQRFGIQWKMCVGLLAAHFCALYLDSLQESGTAAADVLHKAQAAGVVTSESADGVSYSMDVNQLGSDLNGWAAFKLTTFGEQFATIAKLVSKGGMHIW